jgi:RNA polymerase primary sigma factor
MARAQQAVQKTEDKDQAADAPERDSPLLDLSDQAVKRLLKTAKAKGYVTLDQLNSVLPSEEVSSDQIEDLYATLSDMGITVVETEEGEEKEEGTEELADEEEGRALVAQNNALVKSESKAEPAERTCTCARWAPSSFCRAKAKSRSRSASRPAARR